MPVQTEHIEIGPGDHVVHFYERDADLAAIVGRYVIDTIRGGDIAIVIATADHRQAFEAELENAGVDIADATRAGSLVCLDAATTMARFLTESGPDGAAFDATIGGLIQPAVASGRSVRAYGEMVALLWDAGNVIAAMELETLWNALGRRLPFALLCAYPSQSVAGVEHAAAQRQVCDLHSRVLPSEPRHHPADGGELAQRRQFDANVNSPGQARSFVVGALRALGHDSPVVDDAALVVTELATNAVLHARSPFTVAVWPDAGIVRISVIDASQVLPTPRNAPLTGRSGRGLGLVAALAARWGVEQETAGKRVWAELRT